MFAVDTIEESYYNGTLLYKVKPVIRAHDCHRCHMASLVVGWLPRGMSVCLLVGC